MIDALRLHTFATSAAGLAPESRPQAVTLHEQATAADSAAHKVSPASFHGDGARSPFALAPADFVQAFAAHAPAPPAAFETAASSYRRANLLTASSLSLVA